MQHGQARPRPRHRGQGEGQDVEEDEAPVHLVGHLGGGISRSRYQDIYLSNHQLLPDAQRDDELVGADGQEQQPHAPGSHSIDIKYSKYLDIGYIYLKGV